MCVCVCVCVCVCTNTLNLSTPPCTTFAPKCTTLHRRTIERLLLDETHFQNRPHRLNYDQLLNEVRHYRRTHIFHRPIQHSHQHFLSNFLPHLLHKRLYQFFQARRQQRGTNAQLVLRPPPSSRVFLVLIVDSTYNTKIRGRGWVALPLKLLQNAQRNSSLECQVVVRSDAASCIVAILSVLTLVSLRLHESHRVRLRWIYVAHLELDDKLETLRRRRRRTSLKHLPNICKSQLHSQFTQDIK